MVCCRMERGRKEEVWAAWRRGCLDLCETGIRIELAGEHRDDLDGVGWGVSVKKMEVLQLISLLDS
jgi:hypothetical protein